MNPVKVMTICFLIKETNGVRQVCLAEKKRGFRVGTLNGYGGKLENGESLEECALRETWEESGIKPGSARKVGIINFHDWNITHSCHVYVAEDWEGEPMETEEMNPAWYPVHNIPYEKMGPADYLWIPQILSGNHVVANFRYDENDRMYSHEVSLLTGDKLF